VEKNEEKNRPIFEAFCPSDSCYSSKGKSAHSIAVIKISHKINYGNLSENNFADSI